MKGEALELSWLSSVPDEALVALVRPDVALLVRPDRALAPDGRSDSTPPGVGSKMVS